MRHHPHGPVRGGGKDLDNLARLILPALHEIWTPPSHVGHTIKVENIKDERSPDDSSTGC